MRNRVNNIIQKLRQIAQQIPQWMALLRPTQSTAENKQNSPELTLKRSVIYKALLAAMALIMTIVMLFTVTAAWYKNVAHSSGLIFKVNEWGLDSSVSIQEELIGAAPGSSGTITMSVDNTSDGIIGVSPNITKGDMYNGLADMRKRIYFYIDDMVYSGGEHTSKMYLNSTTSYTYTVLANQSLILGKNGNAVPLKWEWVLDVLGYYFYGVVTEEEEADVQEFLRPVEYVFDRATFHNGALETVDGTTTPAEFIETLTATDGYEGTVTTTVVGPRGHVFYPVSVDENGKGVWIYLCSLGEIEFENTVDTNLGTADDEKDRLFEAYLHVLAQQKQLVTTEVASETQLAAALNDNTHDMIKLTADMALSSSVRMNLFGEKILDLNGHTMTGTQAYSLIVDKGAKLTVTNGTLSSRDKGQFAVATMGGDAALCNLTITDYDTAVYVADLYAATADSRVTITGCQINTKKAAVMIYGNDSKTAADSCLVIEDSVLESAGAYVLVGNGSTEYRGTDILLRNSTLRGVDSAIYHPQQDGTLTILGSTIEAATPLAVKGGTVEIMDSTITALTGEAYDKLIEPATLSNSGFACTGAGVYVETNYNQPTSVTIGGDTTITSVHAEAILKFEDTNPQYVITVTGGKYSHDVSAFLAEGYTCSKKDGYWVVSKDE